MMTSDDELIQKNKNIKKKKKKKKKSKWIEFKKLYYV